MRYRIRHRTTYRYDQPVYESFNQVRLEPMGCAEQTVLDFELAIDPPATVVGFRDYYGNAVHDFGVPYVHDGLTIDASSDVVTHAAADEPLTGPAEGDDDSPPLLSLGADPAIADAFAEFLGPSAYVPLDDASAGLARDLLLDAGAERALAFLRRASATVQERLEYRLGSTTVESSVAEVLAGGTGVCQDFAHVLISLCRHAGLPARYVSGYLGSVAEATASHAWVEAYVPPYGWLGMDATHGQACTGAYVKLGVGRDYADVSVLRGTYQGRGGAELEVEVRSELVSAADRMGDRGGGGAWERRGSVMAFQNLGALRQFRRGARLEQRLGQMTQTLVLDEAPPPRNQVRADGEAPMQQPRQQQQGGACG